MTSSATALGRAIVLAVALALVLVGIVTADGTIWPMLAAASGIALAVRLWTVAATSRHYTLEEKP